jgi:hypothetical protein
MNPSSFQGSTSGEHFGIHDEELSMVYTTSKRDRATTIIHLPPAWLIEVNLSRKSLTR